MQEHTNAHTSTLTTRYINEQRQQLTYAEAAAAGVAAGAPGFFIRKSRKLMLAVLPRLLIN